MKKLTKLEHELHLNRLQKYNNFLEIYNDWYYQEYFVKKYINDIPKLAYEVFGTTFTYQQMDIWNEFVKSGGWKGGRLAVSSGHGTGKTRFIGNIVAGFFLLFRKSIIRIQAPKQEQVTKFSWKEIGNAFDNMGRKRKIGDKYITPKWGFLNRYIQVNKTIIYIKGFNEKWYIEPATAPKGDPTNLSGQHNKFYLLIFDEASGIEDTHIEASLGGLSELYNSCIMFSQHTRLQGKFHEFVTAKNVAKGGVWHTLRLSSRYSPMVSSTQLKNWLSTYTEDEVRVRVDGLPPIHQDGTLISDIQAYSIYENNHELFKNETIFKSLVFSYDLAYTGYRDSSVLSVFEVATIKNNITQKVKSYYKIVDIHLFQGFNGKLPMEFIEEVFKIILTTIDEYTELKQKYFDRIFVIGDATAGGHEPFKKLEEMFLELNRYNIEFKPLMWGSEKLYFEDKKRFINGRAKAFVNLKEALEEKRIKSVTEKYKERILNELKNIFYSFDSKFRYKILNKEEMKKKGVNSPDIADTLAQVMLLKFDEVDLEIENQKSEIIEEIEFNENELVELESEFENDNKKEKKQTEEIQKNDDILLPKTLNNFNLDDEF